MSQPRPEEFAPDTPPASHRAGRVARLTLKELRESLRDRRTLITLVLMPLLLYPLLSMVFHKFLLTGTLRGGALTYHVAFAPDGAAELIWPVIENGRQILAQERGPESLPEVLPFVTPDNEQALRDGDLDLVIRLIRGPQEPYRPDRSWEMDCELTVVEGSLNGERAVRHMEDCFRVYGLTLIADRLRMARIPQRAAPIVPTVRRLSVKSQPSVVSLPALVPFVLILMTITGAVYPAIDLTAGERERGTLELLIAAPVPRLATLFAKYVAVLTVAVLTASVNVVAMTGTILLSGLGSMFWGDKGLTWLTAATVFFLLLLLAGFFSAVLLTITSFARSFKEAQAYLIPIMLCALGPGLISLMPGVELRPWLAVTPLLNIALLARDTLQGEASPAMGAVVVVSTAIYAFASLALAARLFAADAVFSDARLEWSDFWRRPRQAGPASLSAALLSLACMFPISFATNGTLAALSHLSVTARLATMVLGTAFVFGGVPWVVAYWRRVPWTTGFLLCWPHPATWLAATLLGLCLWPFVHEITIATQLVGLVTLTEEQLQRAQEFVDACRAVPVWLVLLALAITPAVFEELCFRGFVFTALRARLGTRSAILLSAFLFGVFHLVATDSLALERLIPSTVLGLVLGWVCARTNSVLPGMLLHACHNGLLTLVFYYLPEIKARGWGVEERSHMPWTWLAVAGAGSLAGGALLWFATRREAGRPV